jgi:hypothetical protein
MAVLGEGEHRVPGPPEKPTTSSAPTPCCVEVLPGGKHVPRPSSRRFGATPGSRSPSRTRRRSPAGRPRIRRTRVRRAARSVIIEACVRVEGDHHDARMSSGMERSEESGAPSPEWKSTVRTPPATPGGRGCRSSRGVVLGRAVFGTVVSLAESVPTGTAGLIRLRHHRGDRRENWAVARPLRPRP